MKTENKDRINKLKVGDTIFIHEYSSHSRNAKNCIEVISKIGRKYITTTKNRVIEIATGHERSKVTGALVAKMYPNEYEYSNERKLKQKHQESCELLKNTKSKELIEAVYAILTGKNGWNNNESTRPEYDGTYLVVLDDGQVTTLDYESWEGQWDCYSDDTILYWMEFPEPPEEIKNGKRK